MNHCECGHPGYHPMVHLTLGDTSACVDVEISELVLACWELEIQTAESCQDFLDPHGDDVAPEMFLSFRTMADHLLFATFVIEGGPPTPMFERVIGIAPRGDGPEWDMAIRLDTAAWDGAEPADPPLAGVSPTVTFPPADMAETVSRLRRGALAYPDEAARLALLERLVGRAAR